jgi:hypothetical protein
METQKQSSKIHEVDHYGLKKIMKQCIVKIGGLSKTFKITMTGSLNIMGTSTIRIQCYQKANTFSKKPAVQKIGFEMLTQLCVP